MKLLVLLALFNIALCEEVKYISLSFTANSGHTPTIDIAMGTPPQNFTVILDTGSYAGYLPGTVNGWSANTEYSVYNGSASSTFSETRLKPAGYWNSVTSADFRWFVYDKTYWGLGDGAAEFNVSFVLQTTKQNPIFGLDVRGGENKPYGTPMLAMQKAGMIRNLTFALYYNTKTFTDYTGEYMFGAIDHSKYLNKLTAVPINNGRVTVDNYTYYEQGTEAEKYPESNLTTLPFQDDTTTMFDTGGIKFYLYEEALKDLQKILGAKDGKFSRSVVMARKPVIVYSVGGGAYKFMIYLAERCPDQETFGSFVDIGKTSSNNNAMGPGFFKQVYTVWDYENKRMLFGKRNPSPGAPDIRYLSESDIYNS